MYKILMVNGKLCNEDIPNRSEAIDCAEKTLLHALELTGINTELVVADQDTGEEACRYSIEVVKAPPQVTIPHSCIKDETGLCFECDKPRAS